MIKVEVESYCHNGCRAFEADVEEPTALYSNDSYFTDTVTKDTIIRCRNRKLCKQLVRYLERSNDHAD